MYARVTRRTSSYMRRQWPCSGWRDSPIRQINCVRPEPQNSLRFPRPTTGHFTLDLATETIVVPHPRFFFHRIFLHLPRVIPPIGDVRRADLRPRKIVKEGRARARRSRTRRPTAGELCSPSVTRVKPINFRFVAASPWTAHVDRLGFHGELHIFPRFPGQFHQHRQPLAGRRARRFKAHLNNNSFVLKAAIHTCRAR